MASHASAKKRIRQTIKRTARNRSIRTNVRSLVKNVRKALEEGNAADAQAALKVAVPKLDAMVTKGIFHRKTASRTISRLSSQVAALAK